MKKNNIRIKKILSLVVLFFILGMNFIVITNSLEIKNINENLLLNEKEDFQQQSSTRQFSFLEKEDFMTYIEHDLHDLINIENSTHITYSGPTRWYDGIAISSESRDFSDFKIHSSKSIFSHSSATCMPSCILTSNTSSGEDLLDMVENGVVTVWICHKLRGEGPSIRILGQDEYGVFRQSTEVESESDYILGVTDYLTLSRQDKNITLEIYSDEERNVLRDTVILPNFSSVPLYYLAACSSYNDGNGPKPATYEVMDFIVETTGDSDLIYVDDDADISWYDSTHVKTIQEGIINASQDETVFVYNGTYYENIIINKSINLIGENKNCTIIDGGNNGDVVFIDADFVKLSGFTIRNSSLDGMGIGVWIYKQNCLIHDNKILDTQIGIGITNNYNVIKKNIIKNNVSFPVLDSSGILISSCISNNISNNNISNMYFGIVLIPGPTGIYVFDNTISNCDIGLGNYLCDNPNYFYHNNLINNSQNAYEEMHHSSSWDNGYPSGGNYWDDYNGSDNFSGPGQNISGSDGIGDTPYSIESDNQDNYPLMNPWNYTPVIPICGDADSSGLVDIDDVVYLISYIFAGGPEPEPAYCIGDADGSGFVDIDDVVYLINYIFAGGPPPYDDCC